VQSPLFLISLLTFSLAVLNANEASNPSTTPVAPKDPGTDQQIEREYQQILADDDAAQAEVDRWVRENDGQKTKLGGISQEALEARIRERFKPVLQAYERFTRLHPEDARACLAFGNFLNARHDEAGAQKQWEKALELDPKNAALYNNLACRYSESGQVQKAFDYFDKAIEFASSEATHYHNFGDSVYVFRKSAMDHYGLTEQQVFEKALRLYSNAVRLQPLSFSFGWDFAQTYYALKPLSTEPALVAWTNTLRTARNETERESVYLHFARIKMLAGRLDEAHEHLRAVTNVAHLELKTRLLRRIEEEEATTAKRQ
jgi:tetratricopeptide (TPR) repeat protein